MSSVYGSSILNLDLLLDYNNLINKPTIPQVGYVANGRNFAVALTDNKMFVTVPESDISVATANALGGLKIGYTENGTNYALKLDGDNEAFVTVPPTAITVATANDLGGIKLGFSGSGNNYPVVLDGSSKAYVVVNKTITPASDPLPRNFELSAATNVNAGADVTFSFNDPGEGASDTTVYSQGITHENNTGIFTVSTAGQFLISYHLETGAQSPSNRVYGYSCITHTQSDDTLIAEYTSTGTYYRGTSNAKQIAVGGNASIICNSGDKFKIKYYRLYNMTTGAVNMNVSGSVLRIQRINYTAT